MSLNSSPPSAAYMCKWTGSVLVQIMVCRLNGAKPLSEPVLTYCQLNPKEHISMEFYLEFKYFHWRKCIWTCHLQNGSHFSQMRLDGLLSLQKFRATHFWHIIFSNFLTMDTPWLNCEGRIWDLIWVQIWISVKHKLLQCSIQYHVMLGCVITASDCMYHSLDV